MNCASCRAAVPESALEVHDVAVLVAPPHVRDTGLMAWASVCVGPVRIDGLTVRITTGDSLKVTWPMRKANNGLLHAVAHVVDDALRGRVEAAVIAEYLNAARRAGRRA